MICLIRQKISFLFSARIRHLSVSFLVVFLCLLAKMLFFPMVASAGITSVTKSTWNVIGLDSNTPAFGPYRFPVGAKVCSTTTMVNVPVTFNWDTGGTDNGTYINLRPGSSSSLVIPSIPAGGCADAFFEVELNRVAAAFDQTRRYHISAGGLSTPTPRQIKIERLVSQSRNAITNIEFGTSLASMTSVPNGGSFDLTVGNTYYIRMSGYTATQGYEQLETFVNFPNTIFQVLGVKSTYSSDTSPIVSSPNDKLYADSCGWDSDPTSPNYLSCSTSGKAGGTIQVTYQVKILSVGSGRETLSSLIHDFSGSSFHYNADFSTTSRFVNLVDPTAVTIAKNFSPDPVNSGGTTTLTINFSNPNGGAVSGVSVTDTFPTAPGAMTVATPLSSSNTCGGSLFDNGGGALGAGDPGLRLSGGTLPAYGSCSIKVNVTAPTLGIYTNTTGNLFVGTVNTGKTASDTLTLDDNAVPPPPPPPATCTTPVEMARWTMAPSQGTTTPPVYFTKAADVATATASFAGTAQSIDTTNGNPVNSWLGTGWSLTEGASTFNTPAYFQFTLGSNRYGAVRVAFDYFMGGNADWGSNANNHIYVYSRADSGGFTTALAAAAGSKANWWSTAANATTSGTGTTTFRINADTAGKPEAFMNLDNIVFSGCRAPDPPTITKGFVPASVAVTGTSTLTFTLNNPNATSALSGLAFSDTLPAGLTVATGSTAFCGGTLTRTAPDQLAFTGGSLANGASCNIAATVTATAAGTFDNISGLVRATQTGANTTATGSAKATLTALSPPVIAKSFTPNPSFTSAYGGASTLTFSISNPNTNNALSGIAFTDNFPTTPGLMIVASPLTASNSCGGVLTNNLGLALAPANVGILLTGGTLAAGGSCTISVNITGGTAGSYTNTSGRVSHLLNAIKWNGNTATASLLMETPNPAISLLKQVAPSGTGPWASYLAVATGANVYYKFTVENLGDVALSSVNVTDPAPYLNLASCNWADGDGAPLTAPFNLPVADADNGHLAVCTLGPVVAVVGPHPNTATASGKFGSVTVTDASTATYATTALTLTKTATQAYFLAAGDVLNCSYAINNAGANFVAPTISVTDSKIAAVTCPPLTSIGDLDGDFDTGETLVCTASYTVTASDVTAEQVDNTARANVGGVLTPTATKSVPIGPDLSVIKSNDVGGNAATNSPFNWTLTVSNAASAGVAATFADGQTTLVDDLPVGPSFAIPAVATNAGGATGIVSCAIAANTLTCTANGAVSLPPGGSFSIDVTTTSAVATTLANPKSGGLCRVDPGGYIAESRDEIHLPDNNSCSDSVNVVTPAVTLLKTADKSYFLAASETIVYTYQVRNSGANPIAGPVSVSDDKIVLPATVLCPAVSTAILYATGLPGNGNANLDPGEQVTCTASYTVTAADVTAGEVINNAQATVANAGVPVLSPQVSLTVPSGTDLRVTKLVDNPIPGAGSTVIYTLDTTNLGPNSTGGILVQDILPVGVTYVSDTGGGTYNPGTGTWTVGTLTSGQTAQLTITVTIDAGTLGQTITNTASLLTSTQPDTNAANNSASVDIVVTQYGDLSTSTKTVVDLNGGDVLPGDTLRYSITLINSHTLAASNLRVTDDIRANVDNLSVVSIPASSTDNSTGNGTGLFNNGFLDVSGITVPASSSVTIVFDVSVYGANGSTIDNSATISNPGGIGGTATAPTLTIATSTLPMAGTKQLYLQASDSTGSVSIPQGLSRIPNTSEGAFPAVRIREGDTPVRWDLNSPLQIDLTLNANSQVILQIYDEDNAAHNLRITLSHNNTAGTDRVVLGSFQDFTINATVAVAQYTFNMTTPAAVILAGRILELTIDNEPVAGGSRIYIKPYHGITGNTSRIELNSATVINVDSIGVFADAAYVGGETPLAGVSPGDTARIRSTVSDPFGSYDITSATITLTDPSGSVVVNQAAMTEVFDSGAAIKVYEYSYTIPAGGPIGSWDVRVDSVEGTEGLISDYGLTTMPVETPPNVTLVKMAHNIGVTGYDIPGEIVRYTLIVNNFDTRAIDNNSITLSDPIPSNTELVVSEPAVTVTNPAATGLTLSYIAVDNNTDQVEFSTDGVDFSYQPTDGGSGTDSSVSHIRFVPNGAMNASSSFTVTFKVRIQ